MADRLTWSALLPAAALACAALSCATLWPATGLHAAPRAASATTAGPAWNRAAAAGYLDRREAWWQGWDAARRDHGTICISCHTTVPYALARSSLRAELGEQSATPEEQVLLANVEQRVSRWTEMTPFYSDAAEGPGKTAQSHATEAVMNAVILTAYEAGHRNGPETGYARRPAQLRSVTRAALDEAWALQLTSGEQAGGWLWQDFHLAPWESGESAYQGAALLMVELASAPELFAHSPEDKAHIARLVQYLRRHYAGQPLLNRMYVSWAAAELPELLSRDLLSPAEQERFMETVRGLQQADGGWSLSSLEPRERLDKTAQSQESDGLATSLILLTMQASANDQPGTDSNALSIERGLAWLTAHQEKDGRWRASSLNKERDPDSNIGLFMSDAATGYAVLALEQADAGR